jgi:Rps23 Pro-64 3,4-dihydroxylase Tpa1-like proline 4-hydroxylase
MFNQAVLEDKDSLRQGLEQPYYVIQDALKPEFAEQLYSELLIFDQWSTDSEETFQGEGVPELATDYSYRRKSVFTNSKLAPKALAELNTYFNSDACLAWMTDVSGRKCDNFVGSATRFEPGDHITRHNDSLTVTKPDGLTHRRVVTINYWLSKHWKPEWGGQFVWETPRAEIVPTFNTLVMFLPGPSTHHWVQPVAGSATEPRLSITGWFSTIYEKGMSALKLNLS